MATSFNVTELVANLNRTDLTVVAQEVVCGYPNSDTYAPPPRYLYYASLFFAFATLRFRWLSKIFLGAAAAYAASATVHAFIMISHPAQLQQPTTASIPLVSTQSNLTNGIASIVMNTTTLLIQPDAVELDVDSITAVVVSAYLVGLPLQVWSRTMRSSNITHYIIVFWNLLMLAGTICALIVWPTTDLATPQYRFCYASFLDSESVSNPGWDPSLWQGNWNRTIWNVFEHYDSVWQQLPYNCFYPCFNTSQVIRQSTSLKAVVLTPKTQFAKLHTANRMANDGFQGLVYLAIVLFSVVQFFLYVVAWLRLGTKCLPETIQQPQNLWRRRKQVLEEMNYELLSSWHLLSRACRSPAKSKKEPYYALGSRNTTQSTSETDDPTSWTLLKSFLLSITRLSITVLALIALCASLTLFPICIIAFISWIEWYIRNDGPSNESISQVGQWSPLVSVGVVLLAALLGQLRWRLASKEEVNNEIRKLELKARKLRGRLEKLES